MNTLIIQNIGATDTDFTTTGGLNLGDNLVITDASSPTVATVDTSNTVSTIQQSGDTFGLLGTQTAHQMIFISNNTAAFSIGTSQDTTVSGGNFIFNNDIGIIFGEQDDAQLVWTELATSNYFALALDVGSDAFTGQFVLVEDDDLGKQFGIATQFQLVSPLSFTTKPFLINDCGPL